MQLLRITVNNSTIPDILCIEMKLQSGYKLSRLRIVLSSKLRQDFSSSISTLQKTLELAENNLPSAAASGSSSLERSGLTHVSPSRLHRRAWRVWYNKAPHAIGWSKRHYVFHDWRYAFDFRHINDVKYVINSFKRVIPVGRLSVLFSDLFRTPRRALCI